MIDLDRELPLMLSLHRKNGDATFAATCICGLPVEVCVVDAHKGEAEINCECGRCMQIRVFFRRVADGGKPGSGR